MTERYFISTSPRINGDHTIHRHDCPFLPEPGRRIPLGAFQSPRDAVKEGRNYFRRADSCLFCSKELNDIKRRTFMSERVDPNKISSARMKKAPWMDLLFSSLS